MRILKRVWQAWEHFWFSQRDLKSLAVFRIILTSTMFFMYLSRHRDVTLFYTDQGMLPKSMAISVIPEFFRPYFVFSFWPDSLVPAAHLLLLASLLLVTLGIGGRVLTAIAWLLHISFLQRNYSIAFGADLVGGIFLFYMIFTQSCAELSVWKWFKARYLNKVSAPVQSDILTALFYRIIQVQLCVIYIYTGFEKLKGATWWDGTALWSVFANPQMVIADFTWIRHFPLLIVFLTFMTILFEVYFPVLVWVKRSRPVMLISGILFHLGIGIFMSLYGFAFVMIAPYVLFVSKRDIDEFKTFVLK